MWSFWRLGGGGSLSDRDCGITLDLSPLGHSTACEEGAGQVAPEGTDAAPASSVGTVVAHAFWERGKARKVMALVESQYAVGNGGGRQQAVRGNGHHERWGKTVACIDLKASAPRSSAFHTPAPSSCSGRGHLLGTLKSGRKMIPEPQSVSIHEEGVGDGGA